MRSYLFLFIIKKIKNLSIREFTDPMNDIEPFKIGNVLAIAVNVDRNDINGETKCFANISRMEGIVLYTMK